MFLVKDCSSQPYRLVDELEPGHVYMSSINVGDVELPKREESPDPIVEMNRKALLDRSRVGLQKYGTTIADNLAEPAEWANHMLEELLDAANYAQRLKQELLLLQKFRCDLKAALFDGGGLRAPGKRLEDIRKLVYKFFGDA